MEIKRRMEKVKVGQETEKSQRNGVSEGNTFERPSTVGLCGSPCMPGALAACTGLSQGCRGCPACPSQSSVPGPSPVDPTAASGASRLCGPHLVTPSCSQDSLVSSRVLEPPLPHAQYPLIPKKVCGLGIHW